MNVIPNPDKPEPKMINHENTKFGKHEIFLFFRAFVIKKFFPVIQKEQVVLNVEAAPTEGLSNETWTFQISRKVFS
jgi:hypothetical protein